MSLDTHGENVFHHLPSDDLLEIMKHSPDFSTLWGLLNASVAFASAFDLAAPAIVRAIMPTIPAPISSVIQAVLQLRTASFPYESIESTTPLFIGTSPLPLFQADQIRSVLDYLEEVKGWNHSASGRISLPAITTDNTFNWPMSSLPCSQDKRSIGEAPNSIPMGYRFSRVLVTDCRSPLRYLPFAPYRKYGFAFWDTKRMVDLGFMPTPAAMHPLLLTELYFTWRSILSEEEGEMAWREQQARGL